VVPIFIVAQLGKDLAESLNLAAKAEEKFESKKIK